MKRNLNFPFITVIILITNCSVIDEIKNSSNNLVGQIINNGIRQQNSILAKTRLFDKNKTEEIEKYLEIRDENQKEDSLIFINPEVAPTYKNGGGKGLLKFISDNLNYPKEHCVEGRVIVGFTVDTLGRVKDIEIKRGIIEETDKEAIRIVKMLTFIPGSWQSKLVETKMVLPISFTLE